MLPADPRDRALDPKYRDHDLTTLQRMERRLAALETAVANLEKKMSQSGYIPLEDALVKIVTAHAAFIEYTDALGEVGSDWFPRSQIADAETLSKGGPQTVMVTEWIAVKKGILT